MESKALMEENEIYMGCAFAEFKKKLFTLCYTIHFLETTRSTVGDLGYVYCSSSGANLGLTSGKSIRRSH
jgi:hypothetical protein